MDFTSLIMEVSEASKLGGEVESSFSKQSLDKFYSLFEDTNLDSKIEQVNSAQELNEKEIEDKFDKLFEEASEEKNEDVENTSNPHENSDVVKQDELTEDEINQKQIESIMDAFKRIAKGEKLTDAEKGNLGEMLMDQYYISQGYEPIHSPRVTDLEHKAPQGIDGVYEKTNLDGTKSYVIADAKVNQSQLSKGLADGTNQMSDEWIDKRLDNAVGKEKADEIRDSYEDDPSSVSREVYHYSYGDAEDGSSKADIFTVDEDGNSNRDKEVVQVFDSDGNVIENRGRGEIDA